MICSNCKHILKEENQHCPECGKPINSSHHSGSNHIKYPIDFTSSKSVFDQIRTYFFQCLEKEVSSDFGEKEYRAYFDEFYKGGFYKKFDLRTEQLAEEIKHLDADNIDHLLNDHFYGFIDHFVLLHAKKLHKMDLPETILKYTNIKKEAIDMRQMVLDYLDFDSESDKVYTDFLTIPPKKLKNAVNSFLFALPEETIFFICDQTIFGSCEEGFAMSDQGLYWKSHFNPAQVIQYKDLKTIEKEAEWISINGLFFNVNKTLNYKMMKLLRKIQRLGL